MNESVKSSLIFAAGLAIGSVVTWLSVKGHYKEEKEDAIEALREEYAKRDKEIGQEALEKVALAKNKPDLSVYTQALQQAREHETEMTEDEEKEVEQEFGNSTSNLYEITQSEFASFSNDRTRVTITRFADDVYADEAYNELDPMDYLSGDLIPLNDSRPVNCLDYIRRMSQDEICVRNFDLGLDIDVWTESRPFSDYTTAT